MVQGGFLYDALDIHSTRYMLVPVLSHPFCDFYNLISIHVFILQKKKRIKRAETNKRLGVKRLKIQPILKPKTVTYCRHYLRGRCQEVVYSNIYYVNSYLILGGDCFEVSLLYVLMRLFLFYFMIVTG